MQHAPSKEIGSKICVVKGEKRSLVVVVVVRVRIVGGRSSSNVKDIFPETGSRDCVEFKMFFYYVGVFCFLYTLSLIHI